MGEALATAPDQLLRDFASRGLVVLPPEALGIPQCVHETIYEKQKQALADNPRTISATTIPEILEVINAPGLVAVCDQIVGERWAIVPFTHNAPFVSGAHDQHWHKDDNGPFNGRKQRHHHAVQVEMLYYPQAVANDAGPTATVPYSQYWAFNHEENHDNFAGADHLDFGYHLSGMERVPVSGPKSTYDEEDIRNRQTRHDIRMRSAVANTGWPLVSSFEVAPLKAGSVVLYSHNLFHRGNHRIDDWRTWKTHPRFLWRFWLYRTREPATKNACDVDDVDWNALGVDTLTGANLACASDDATVVWRYHHHWLQGCLPAPHARRPSHEGALSRGARGASPSHAKALFERLHAVGEGAEPIRVGAAYKLALLGDGKRAASLFGTALRSERETVRRAAMYGLAALGADATDTLLDACESPLKWVRKAAVFGLGEAGRTTPDVLAAIAKRLREDSSVYVRSVAAAALGCFGRRVRPTQDGCLSLLPACMAALVASLRREENRLAMNLAQDRSIKIVRPTDECDVCEGIGVNYGTAPFEPVRSAVRENALWAAVILCSHGVGALGAGLASVLEALTTVVRQDRNIFSVGLALDALVRLGWLVPDDCSLAARERAATLLAEMPLASWECWLRAGYPAVPRTRLDWAP